MLRTSHAIHSRAASHTEPWEWCRFCAVSFNTEKASKLHLKSERHKRNTGQAIQREAVCHDCHRSFTRRSDAIRHKRLSQCKNASGTITQVIPPQRTREDKVHSYPTKTVTIPGNTAVGESITSLIYEGEVLHTAHSDIQEPSMDAAAKEAGIPGEEDILELGRAPWHLRDVQYINPVASNTIEMEQSRIANVSDGDSPGSSAGDSGIIQRLGEMTNSHVQGSEMTENDSRMLQYELSRDRSPGPLALARAIYSLDFDETKSLLEFGADPSTEECKICFAWFTDKRYRPMLPYVADNNRVDLIDLLCHYGANPFEDKFYIRDAVVRGDLTDAHYAMIRNGAVKDPGAWERSTASAIIYERSKNDVQILVEHSPLPDLSSCGFLLYDAIQHAVIGGKSDTIESLLPLRLSSLNPAFFSKESTRSLLELAAGLGDTGHYQILQMLLNSTNQKWSPSILIVVRNTVITRLNTFRHDMVSSILRQIDDRFSRGWP